MLLFSFQIISSLKFVYRSRVSMLVVLMPYRNDQHWFLLFEVVYDTDIPLLDICFSFIPGGSK